MGTPGFIPGLLTQLGLNEVICAYRQKENGASLTMLAPAQMVPAWAGGWEPLNQFPIPKKDPGGFVELAFRMPISSATEDATRMGFAPRGGEPTNSSQNASATPSGDENFLNMMGQRDRTSNRMGNRGNFAGSGPGMNPDNGMENRGDPPGGRMNAGNGRGRNRGNRFEAGMLQNRMFTQFFPSGKVVGLNVFGFHGEQPAFAMIFPDLEQELPWVSRFGQMPMIQSSKIEIAKIPATQFALNQSPFGESMGLDELVFLERDAVTYLFDSTEAAKNYFGEIQSDPNTPPRVRDWSESLLQEVFTPAQMEGVISKDLFTQWLTLEKTRLADKPALQEEIANLTKDVEPFLEPMSFSGGLCHHPPTNE